MKRKNIKSLLLKPRMSSIISEIRTINPDIFCLQESTYEVFTTYIQPQFQKEYTLITYDNTDSFLMNVTAIRKKRFTLKNSINFDMQSVPKCDVRGNRGIIWTEIIDTLNNNTLIDIYNVHFPWKPIYEYEKAHLFNFLLKHILQKGNDKFIICGDFNSIPNSIVIRMIYYPQWINELELNDEYIKGYTFTKSENSLMKYMRNKMKKKEYFRTMANELLTTSKLIYNNYQIKSAYELYRNDNNNNTIPHNYYFLTHHPPFTNKTETFCDTLDYIIYSSKGFVLNKITKLPLDPIYTKDYLPNSVLPSDHLKLVSVFNYK
jgi:mRNA deadenylase 3'-5' endonuclease subunit Ccr4